MVLDDDSGAEWCWMMRQVQCGAGAVDRCSVVLDDRCSVVLDDRCSVVLD